VFLEQRSTHIAVETVREMVRQVAQSTVENLRFVAEYTDGAASDIIETIST